MLIETISDLAKATPEEIEAARRSVDFAGAVYKALRQEGQKPGMTREDWEEAYKARTPKECPTCHGDGQVLEKMRTVGTIHASSATKCVAALYYDVTGEFAPKQDLSPALLITFQIGHAIHDYIQRLLYKVVDPENGPLFHFADEVNVNLPEALICNGSADGESDWPLCRCVLEIKSISGDEFLKLRKPKKEHIVQAAGLYAKGLDVPFISFLYVSKTWPHDTKEYVLAYDEDVFQKWYAEKGLKVEQALEQGKPPLAKASAYECKQCGYKNDCPQAAGLRDRFSRS